MKGEPGELLAREVGLPTPNPMRHYEASCGRRFLTPARRGTHESYCTDCARADQKRAVEKEKR